MKSRWTKRKQRYQGSVLALAMILTLILALTGFAILKAAEGKMIQTVRIKSQESASSAAEAGYEKAVFWMSEQVDMLTALSSAQSQGTLAFTQSNADYTVTMASFLGFRPVFEVKANGYCGIYKKTINAYVVQAVAGWEMGQCRIPSNATQTAEVSFITGEILDIPIHINNLNDNPDNRDIYISGTPSFLNVISMGEPRYTSGGADKYNSAMNLFTAGISFGQPASRIYDAVSVATKVTQFRDSTNASYRFTPTHITLPKSSNGKTGFYSATVSDLAAVQLKFYVNGSGQGYVRIYNNCTVAGYTRSSTGSTWDYKIDPTGTGTTFVQYPIYGCHYNSGTYTDVRVDDPSSPIYVRQTYGGAQSAPGAQIYVNGNVIIGSDSTADTALGTLNTVKGQVSIVASGNIWIANELKVDGAHDTSGLPSATNTNIIGLIAQGVIKVVDPGMTYPDSTDKMLYDQASYNAAKVANYSPIGSKEGALTYNRALPRNMVVEAAMTVGGGGWGAENVARSGGSSSNPGRETVTGSNDYLIVRGSITEAFRGVVGSGNNGYLKQYYYDERLMTGILPGNMGLKGKYLLIPGGWSEVASLTSQ
jgi:hypothetical protein